MTTSNQKLTYQKELKKIVQALVRDYRPEKIILFGSLLNSKQPNDIDLFIVKKTKLQRLGDRANQAREYLPDPTFPVDLIIYTPEEVKKAEKIGSVLLPQVYKGKVLYEQEI